MRSAPRMRKFVGRYREGNDSLLPVRLRMLCAQQIRRIERGLREKPGTFSCEDRISSPLVVPNEFPFRFRRVAAAMRRERT